MKMINMDDLMEALAEIDAGLDKTIGAVHKAIRLADRYGGEVSRVMAGQLYSYLLGSLERFRDDEQQPGSVAGLRVFLEEEMQQEEEEEEEEVSYGQAG